MRPSNWNRLISDHMRETMKKPFERGKTDCVTFIADCVEIETGIDPIKEGRGYESIEAGFAVMREYGCNSLADIMDRHFKREPQYRRLRKGDVVFRVTDTGETLGLVWDNSKVFFRVENGGFDVAHLYANLYHFF